MQPCGFSDLTYFTERFPNLSPILQYSLNEIQQPCEPTWDELLNFCARLWNMVSLTFSLEHSLTHLQLVLIAIFQQLIGNKNNLFQSRFWQNILICTICPKQMFPVDYIMPYITGHSMYSLISLPINHQYIISSISFLEQVKNIKN